MTHHAVNIDANRAYATVGRALARPDYSRALQRLELRHAGLVSLIARNLSDARRRPGNSECAAPWLETRDVLELRRQGFTRLPLEPHPPAGRLNDRAELEHYAPPKEG